MTIATRGTRAETRAELSRTTYDLLVIGGGILGTSVTWMAAQAGLRVAMVDAGDFAGATSSASSKLVHGGLRYLQTGNLKLVAENHRERRALAADVAPHLVTPLSFVVPIYRGGPHGAAKLGAGVFLYSALSAFGDGLGRVVTPQQALARVPALRAEGLRAAAVYGDPPDERQPRRGDDRAGGRRGGRGRAQPRRGGRPAYGPRHRLGRRTARPPRRRRVRRRRPPGAERDGGRGWTTCAGWRTRRPRRASGCPRAPIWSCAATSRGRRR
ncbi:hypothetical protein GCM10020219_048260 [Nonomuraea dietziae]